MTAITLVLRTTNALNIQTSKQPMKPLLRSVSAPLMPSPAIKTESTQGQPVSSMSQFVFRTEPASHELEDMWTLKRATPVFDEEEDEDESLESPTKRSRTFFDPFPEERDSDSSIRQGLSWDCQIREDENGFTLLL